jgi:hypothetical protein
VDANGVLRKIDMSTPDFLKAAAGCFGLIGVVTHLVLEFDPMSFALMEPRKLSVVEAIPPPPDMKDSAIPAPLRPKQPLSTQRKAEIQQEFENRALNHDYAEWFWFPYSSEVWVNTWRKTDNPSNAVSYPSDVKTILQVFGTIMINIAQNATSLLRVTDFLPEKQTKLLTWLAMKNLDDVGPHGKKIKTFLPDALHFQRGVQNIRVRDLEVEFPLLPKQHSPGTTPSNDHINGNAYPTHQRQIDFTTVQRAWWDAILTCYTSIRTCPQRMPLEMRIMSGSDVTLAPQRGHRLGTCAIEILTLHSVADIWPAYAQKVLDKWSSYRDHQGKLIPIRPHWAKEWAGYKLRGRPWAEVLKDESAGDGGFRDELVEWRALVGRLGRRDGWNVEEARMRFGNEVLDWLVWDHGKVEFVEGPGVKSGTGDLLTIRGAGGGGSVNTGTVKGVTNGYAAEHRNGWRCC